MSAPSHTSAWRLHQVWAENRARRKAEREHAGRHAQESHSLGDDSAMLTEPPPQLA